MKTENTYCVEDSENGKTLGTMDKLGVSRKTAMQVARELSVSNTSKTFHAMENNNRLGEVISYRGGVLLGLR